jgi:hypothetical protein
VRSRFWRYQVDHVRAGRVKGLLVHNWLSAYPLRHRTDMYTSRTDAEPPVAILTSTTVSGTPAMSD